MPVMEIFPDAHLGQKAGLAGLALDRKDLPRLGAAPPLGSGGGFHMRAQLGELGNSQKLKEIMGE